MSWAFPGRARVDLGGEWAYEPLARTEFRGSGELVAETRDLPPSGTMPVPSNWHRNGGAPDGGGGLAGFHGRVRFTRDLPALDGDGWWLCLGGVDYLAEVVVDGVTLCRHEGAFDGFAIALAPGARRLEVVVDAPSEELGSLFPYRKRQLKGIFTQWEPMEPFQDSTGGIWGDVWLEQRPDAHIAAVRTSTFLVPRPAIERDAYVDSGATDARVLVDVDVVATASTSAEIRLSVCGAAASRALEVPAGHSSHRLAVTVVDPVLWWPWDVGSPVLHDVEVALGDEVAHGRLGIREVQLDETTGVFTVNGEAVPIRGSNIIPEKWLATYDDKRARADVELARAANVNALRVCVHAATDAFYDACDEAGVLVWQDLPLQWDYLIDDALVVEAADQAERIVRRLHDHPSIALWSCHNEPYPTNRQHFAGPLIRAVRAVDGTRTVHPASDFSEHAYPGWFFGDLRDYALGPTAPVMSEFGALALPSADEVRALGGTTWPPAGKAWSLLLHEPSPLFDVAGVTLGDNLEELVAATQRYQARAVQRGVEAYRLGGVPFFHFLFMDGWPTVSWSVVSYDRTPKLGYFAFQRACAPVLVGADITREVVSDAWDAYRFPPLGGVWVVNDTRDALPGARWTARLGGSVIGEGQLDVVARGVSRWAPPGQRWPSWDPPSLDGGEHDLELILHDADGRLRSTNAYAIRVVQRGLDLSPPHTVL